MVSGRALVVGSTAGIGLALSKQLLAEDWRVVGISKSAAAITAPGYEHALVDVSAVEYPHVLGSLLASHGPFDVCVYCAGIGEQFDATDLSAEPATFRVNLLGAVETSSQVLGSMLAAGRGHFLALSSLGDGISAVAPSYAASKAGLSSYLAGLALALSSRGVHVTNVRFGFVATKMAKSAWRPFMMTPERAADLVVTCLKKRPARFSYPKQMALLTLLMSWASLVRLWFA